MSVTHGPLVLADVPEVLDELPGLRGVLLRDQVQLDGTVLRAQTAEGALGNLTVRTDLHNTTKIKKALAALVSVSNRTMSENESSDCSENNKVSVFARVRSGTKRTI